MTHEQTLRSAKLFVSLAGRYTLVVVEHDMDFIERIARKVTVLHEGGVLAEGSMDEIQRNEQVAIKERRVHRRELARMPPGLSVVRQKRLKPLRGQLLLRVKFPMRLAVDYVPAVTLDQM
jgi:ABC-type methionine transport system ATPase subunit